MVYKRNKRNKIHKDCISGNKTVDEFIRYTQINGRLKTGRMTFAPYNQFKNVEFFAEGGFSKLYKAIWTNNRKNKRRNFQRQIALKRLNGSKNITSKDLNEVSHSVLM